ncbi:RNA polymerase sigma factor (sigma-70 family) [Neobacillus niacini]|uniref:sigma-70 family RNA polymerase sigma factor n=1 Tax=Neobacillus driksii TaxID=3035913 RepID=UPI00278B865E|nr:sigma-70 family RNA polymerase sigma factor [Neobacillus niacini]MDQ0971761.1 RNA polymerase sigma factor (sigma-70 family) [Neobacillus niacini]
MLVKKKETTSSPIEIHELTKEDQLSWLMEEYGDMVVRLAFTYVKQKQLAEDISQEVFVSCYKSLETFQNKASYKTWLYRITVNKCKDYFRTWSYRNISYQDFFRSIFPSGGQSVEEEILEGEEKEIIFEKVLALPIKLREVIILQYYEELTVNEISELLGLNSNTVKTRLHRAKKLLQCSLKERHSYGG